jgi:hypothetical protein
MPSQFSKCSRFISGMTESVFFYICVTLIIIKALTKSLPRIRYSRIMYWIYPQATHAELLDNNATNIENMDNLRVEELNQLSQEARERAQEELHCVVDELIEEEPEFLKRRLAQLDDEISKIRKKSAYDRALFLSPSYVRDRDFALMFLRSADFHPRKASECMIAHFELKLELFGLECLARAVTLEDLNQEDIVTLEAGNWQYLFEKDRGGRAVYCGLYKAQQNASRVSTKLFVRGICWLSFVRWSQTPIFVSPITSSCESISIKPWSRSRTLRRRKGG